jgi:hypothetical protein
VEKSCLSEILPVMKIFNPAKCAVESVVLLELGPAAARENPPTDQSSQLLYALCRLRTSAQASKAWVRSAAH